MVVGLWVDGKARNVVASARAFSATKAQQRLLQDFHKPREVDSLDVSDPVTVDTSADSDDQNLTLHDLCGEAVSTDDIAWRNALCLLATQPTLASAVDRLQLWTPLHICCLGMSPPPTYIVRAFLYVYPRAAPLADEGGRLPLHLVAASSANVETMQKLVEENPAALYHADDHGLAPLHLLIRNGSVEQTVENAKILRRNAKILLRQTTDQRRSDMTARPRYPTMMTTTTFSYN